jgi:hypothetical protein
MVTGNLQKDGRERSADTDLLNRIPIPPGAASRAALWRENLIRRPPDEIFALVDLIG